MGVFDFNRALVRQPCAEVVDGLRTGNRGDPSFEGIAKLHQEYIEALEQAGLRVTTLPPLPAFPDSVFIEDPALVFEDAAILLNPGAPARQAEAAELTPILQKEFGRLLLLPGGTVDGGDILVTPDRILIGLSRRTNERGAKALVDVLASIGRTGIIVRPPPGVLHLKTASGLIDEETILTTPALAACGVFDGFRVVTVPEREQQAANVLRLNSTILAAANCPASLDILARADVTVIALDTSEIEKIDGGLTCLSLRWFSPDMT